MADAQIAAEIAALDEFLERTSNRQFASIAHGARLALEWVRDSRQADPMNPRRMISLLEFTIEPHVLDFKLPPHENK